ncbi:MAG: SUMF1/EgtB/PvdO family nonheme iron enzyme [Verrucomicrobiales bacterium]|nr:SUMF1/EgtB/PvdO family nonheme iron enzyme [Verrucomicrobiales bacterium]
MAPPDPEFGVKLDAWLDHLDQVAPDRRRLGIRERLAVHQLMDRLRDSSELPGTDRECLALLAPLICTSPEGQRGYAGQIDEFLVRKLWLQPETPAGASAIPQVEKGSRKPPVPWHWFVAALLAMAVVGWAVFEWRNKPVLPEQQRRDESIWPYTNTVPRSGIVPNAGFTYYTNQVILPGQGSIENPKVFQVRAASWGIAALCGIGVLVWLWGWLRRRLYLRQTRTDREIEEKVLGDPSPKPSPYPPEGIRAVARGLRQRIAGEREVLHLGETVRASVRAAGAFTPRFRRLHVTPEYVVLVDRRHSRDHFARLAAQLAAALHEQGVALDLFSFDGSPEFGCRRWKPWHHAEPDGPSLDVAEFSGCVAGARLLVFAEAAVALSPASGLARPWTTAFRACREKAWFTPMPMPSWGSAENGVGQLGYLVLPVQMESLDTLVGWLASDQQVLRPGNDWPLAYPAMLRDEAVSWVSRQAEPPEALVETLLYEMRNYLGAIRFQWLCACAVFPSVAPSLTRALGAELICGEEHQVRRGLILGSQALASLPFFRYGHLPEWLRRALVKRLTVDNRRRLRRVIEERLGKAVDGDAEELIHLAQPQFRGWSLGRLWAWMQTGRGLSRDVVLVEFLRPGHLSPLVQRLPEALRRRLFRHGLAAHGVRNWVVFAALMMGLLAMFVPRIASRIFPPTVSGGGNMLTNAVTVTAFTNSLGMVFLPIDVATIDRPTAKQGTSTPDRRVWFCVWETRVRDYEEYARSRSAVDSGWRDPEYQGVKVTPGPDHPVVNVSWKDAQDFCEWLTEKELGEGHLKKGQRYRLPTDLEWSWAVGLTNEIWATPSDRSAKVPNLYPWGKRFQPDDYTGNFSDESTREVLGVDRTFIDNYQDGQVTTSPVGTYASFGNGLYDLSGNVWEWCEDWYDTEQKTRVLRGGSWRSFDPRYLLSSYRSLGDPDGRGNSFGFRVVLDGDGSAR